MKRQLRVIRKMQFAFGAVLVVLLAVGFVSYRSLIASAESERWVQHTHEVLEHLESLFSKIADIETGYRGFVLSGEGAFLKPSRADISLVEQEEKTLRALTADNPYQQSRLTILAGLAEQVIRRGDTLVRLRQTGGPETAAEVIRQGQSEKNLDEFRAVTSDMEDEERHLLLERNADASRRFHLTKAAIIVGSVLGLLITVVAGWIVRRDYGALGRAEQKYRGLLEAAPDAMVVVDQCGEIPLLNVQAEKQFGYHHDELLGQQVKKIIPEGFAERLIADGTRTAAEALAQDIGTGVELSGRRKDGSEFPIEIMLSPLESDEGILVTAAIRDISVRKSTEKHLARMEGKYRALLEAAPDAMVVVNQGGEIVLLNVQAEKQFGYHRDELLGQQVKKIIPEGFAERLIADGTRTAAEALAQDIGTGVELSGRRKDGSEFPIEIMLSPLESDEGILVTAAIRNVSTVRAMSRQMTHSAQHDFLTGLPNRALVNDRISQAIAFAQRHKKKVAVLFLDLDGFKHINDSLGHPVGDKLLQSIAKRLINCVRVSDTVSRQGGDEFLVLLSEVERSEDAAMKARQMLHSVAEVHSIDRHDLHITASIGVSVYPDDGLDAETLIKNADTAMYQGKENGHQSYKFFKPAMNVRAVERQSVEESLRTALKRQEFALHYQPKINLRTGEITGAEALIRWTHPIRGPVPPVQFISVAEDCGLIVPIGNWVLREACRQAQTWVDAGLPQASIAVNISAIEFRSENFLEGVLSVLQETGLNPRSLELELTESVLMKHPESTESILKALRARGVRVAVDDFGTGYSSLSYLRKFPLDALKIDRSFVHQITTDPDETIIVAAVISMGRSLNLRVIAEGVETQEELAFLQAHQCDEAQGYYFGRPVLPLQFATLLETGVREMLASRLPASGGERLLV